MMAFHDFETDLNRSRVLTNDFDKIASIISDGRYDVLAIGVCIGGVGMCIRFSLFFFF